MALRIKDLGNVARSINHRLEARSRARGAEFADRVMASTSSGRGLWFIILWPAWMLIFAFSSSLFISVLSKAGVHAPLSYLGLVGGFLFARTWYHWEFTRRHPFWGSGVGYFGTAMGVLFLAEKFSL